jgi:hypothetical protein
VVLRKWQSIPIQYELRGFIFNDKLAALCQYYDEVVYPDLVENREEIVSLALEFFEKVNSM